METLNTRTGNKYRITDNTKVIYVGDGPEKVTLHQIEGIDGVHGGKLGGWIESERNLSQEGGCWIYQNAMVYGNAVVKDDAFVIGSVSIYGDAMIYGKCLVGGNAVIYGNAKIHGSADIEENAIVYGNADIDKGARVVGNANILGNAKLTDMSEVSGYATIGGNAIIQDHAMVRDSAIVDGDAIIGNYVSLGSYDYIGTDAYLTNNSDYITLIFDHSHEFSSTFYKNKNGDIRVIQFYDDENHVYNKSVSHGGNHMYAFEYYQKYRECYDNIEEFAEANLSPKSKMPEFIRYQLIEGPQDEYERIMNIVKRSSK